VMHSEHRPVSVTTGLGPAPVAVPSAAPVTAER
jgi:hypothetical protein